MFKLKAAEHSFDFTKKFKNVNYGSHAHLYHGLLDKIVNILCLANCENGGIYTLAEIEAVKDQLRFAAEEIDSQVDIDLSSGLRFLPGPLSPLVSNTEDAKDNSS